MTRPWTWLTFTALLALTLAAGGCATKSPDAAGSAPVPATAPAPADAPAEVAS